MSTEWIKMRKSLLGDPKVVRIMSALKADRFRTIGGLFSAWCLLDEQTTDGKLIGYTPDVFDELVGFPGLAAAMAKVGWLEIGEDFVAAPRFFEHNGQTAKRRAQDAVRKSSARHADKVTTIYGQSYGLELEAERELIAAARAAAIFEDFETRDLDELKRVALKLGKATKLSKDFVWSVAVAGELLSPGMVTELACRIATGEVSKPKAYLDSAMRDECGKRGLVWSEVAKLVPKLNGKVEHESND